MNVSWHYIKHHYFMWLNFLHLDVRLKLKDILYLIFEPHIYLFVVIKSNPIFSCSMRIFDDLQWSLKLFSTTLRWWRFVIITLIIITNCCVKYPKHHFCIMLQIIINNIKIIFRLSCVMRNIHLSEIICLVLEYNKQYDSKTNLVCKHGAFNNKCNVKW